MLLVEGQGRRELFFFFNDTATTEIYTLSLHDALPIYPGGGPGRVPARITVLADRPCQRPQQRLSDRKSTRLNSSHSQISYAVFCLKKKNAHLLRLGLRFCSSPALLSLLVSCLQPRAPL